jgi:flagellar FliJ protein
MKFRFPLQKVMQHRKTLEDLAQGNFHEALAELHKQEYILNEMLDAVKSARDAAFQSQSGGGQASSTLVQVDEFLKGQDIRIGRQREKIKECESLVENLREILREKAIDYKIIEGLRDRRLEEHKVEQNKREQKMTDDMNLMRFRREESGK